MTQTPVGIENSVGPFLISIILQTAKIEQIQQIIAVRFFRHQGVESKDWSAGTREVLVGTEATESSRQPRWGVASSFLQIDFLK